MTYGVEVAPAAFRQLRKLDAGARRRVQAAIELLAEQPRPSGAKKLVGGDGEWRVRTGDYRIVYEVRDRTLVVWDWETWETNKALAQLRDVAAYWDRDRAFAPDLAAVRAQVETGVYAALAPFDLMGQASA